MAARATDPVRRDIGQGDEQIGQKGNEHKGQKRQGAETLRPSMTKHVMTVALRAGDTLLFVLRRHRREDLQRHGLFFVRDRQAHAAYCLRVQPGHPDEMLVKKGRAQARALEDRSGDVSLGEIAEPCNDLHDGDTDNPGTKRETGTNETRVRTSSRIVPFPLSQLLPAERLPSFIGRQRPLPGPEPGFSHERPASTPLTSVLLTNEDQLGAVRSALSCSPAGY